MTVEQLLVLARSLKPLGFDAVMSVINEYYDYTPAAFGNGLAARQVNNNAGQNEGSCKLLAFARLHQLDQSQTLNLFGDYYHQEVLGDPAGNTHANIRAFMADGWKGVAFETEPLGAKS